LRSGTDVTTFLFIIKLGANDKKNPKSLSSIVGYGGISICAKDRLQLEIYRGLARKSWEKARLISDKNFMQTSFYLGLTSAV
jgi:hypothetical protein